MNEPDKSTVTQPVTEGVPYSSHILDRPGHTLQPQPLAQDSHAISKHIQAQDNLSAKQAMICGFIAMALSLVTFISLIGLLGYAIGTLAVVAGSLGLNHTEETCNRKERSQAISGIALGLTAWVIVIFSLILRHPI